MAVSPCRAQSLVGTGAALPLAPSAVAIVEPSQPPRHDAGTSSDVPLRLSLDDAIALALKDNTQVELAKQQQRLVSGEILTVGNALLPALRATAYTRTQQINLAAMGFKPGTLGSIPGLAGISIPQIVKVDTTSAQVSLSQALFNLPAYYLYRSARKAAEAASWNTLNTRGAVVLQVGDDYLQALADQAQIANAQALILQDQVVLRNARASQSAGVGVRVDVLRAQVQLQSQQQTLIAAQNTWQKDKIALNRVLGIAADQQIELTDRRPFSALDTLSIEDARALAYTRRKDLLGLLAQQDVANEARKAVRFQYLPTVDANGFYGVLGETQGLYHGVFAATGSLRFPIFDEGQLRGEREVAEAQSIALRQQIAALKTGIEAEIRMASLDVQSSSELVRVARLNAQLSLQALDDATLRFNAGVDDSVPLVQAQATFAGAQTRVIEAEFGYNQAKLQLARRTGVIESEYKRYLGGRP